MNKDAKNSTLGFWSLVWLLGLAGQLCWNMENQWFNTFVYAKIAKDPTIISWMPPIIKTSGEFVDEYGFTEYLPTNVLFLAGVFILLMVLIPLVLANREHMIAAD